MLFFFILTDGTNVLETASAFKISSFSDPVLDDGCASDPLATIMLLIFAGMVTDNNRGHV
jgi:hypothetical protein